MCVRNSVCNVEEQPNIIARTTPACDISVKANRS